MQAKSKLLSSEWNMFFSCLSKILPNLICSRRLLLSRCCRLFRMRKLVMGFVVMSQVLLILEHLVAVLAFKRVVVLKEQWYIPLTFDTKSKQSKGVAGRNLVTLLVAFSMWDRVEDDSAEWAAVSHSFMWGLVVYKCAGNFMKNCWYDQFCHHKENHALCRAA